MNNVSQLLRSATEGSRDLDARIHEVIFNIEVVTSFIGEPVFSLDDIINVVPFYTSKVDDALELLPERWELCELDFSYYGPKDGEQTMEQRKRSKMELFNARDCRATKGIHKVPAIAICMAMLEAIADEGY